MDKKEQRIEIIIVGDETGATSTISCEAGIKMIMQALPTVIAEILIKTSKDPIRFTAKILKQYKVKEYIEKMEENGSEKESYERAKDHARADA